MVNKSKTDRSSAMVGGITGLGEGIHFSPDSTGSGGGAQIIAGAFKVVAQETVGIEELSDPFSEIAEFIGFAFK